MQSSKPFDGVNLSSYERLVAAARLERAEAIADLILAAARSVRGLFARAKAAAPARGARPKAMAPSPTRA
jgi:hypothetical protein